MPKVSIILPIYNVEQYLEECMDSIVNQTLEDIEVICVDDGSTDNSGKILDKYAKKDKRIKVIHKENEGAAIARNVGINNANGKYLLILDGDDCFSNQLCEKLYNSAVKYNTDITICHSVEFDNKTNSDLPSNWIIKDKFLPSKKVFNYKDIPDHIIGFTQGWSWDKLYKTSFVRFHNLQFQNLKATNDMYFVMLSLVLADKITVIDDVLVRHRQNIETSISNSRDKNPYCFIEAIYKLKNTLEEKLLYIPVKRSFINWNVEFCFWHLDTLKQKENEIKLAKRLKKEVFNVLDVYGLDEEYFYNKKTFIRIHSKNLYKYTKWYQNIFSINNSKDKKYKVITVFGIKIKIKRRGK